MAVFGHPRQGKEAGVLAAARSAQPFVACCAALAGCCLGLGTGGGPAYYEIRVAGVLDGERWATWFNGLQVSGQGGETLICGLVADQPALQGLLTKVRDLGLCLISVRRLDTGQSGDEAYGLAWPFPQAVPGSGPGAPHPAARQPISHRPPRHAAEPETYGQTGAY